MRKFNTKKMIRILMVTLSFLLISGIIYAFSSGITGRTLRGPDPGCTCHGGSPTPSVIVTIQAPDSIAVNQSAIFNVTITGGPLVRAGTNIAVARGTLDTVGSILQNMTGELTHLAPLLPSTGTVVIPFRYTAPSVVGIDTIYATGNSVNFNNANTGDQWNYAPNKIIRVVPPSGIQNIGTEMPDKYELYQNYPNPFNPTTNIRFDITNASDVKLTVYDILGKEVAVLVNENLNAGSYEVDWNATQNVSGVYLYSIETDNFVAVKKMLLIK